jgi:hypothetical protein
MRAKVSRKTITRTIRLPEPVDAMIQKDAKDGRMTVNLLISSILTKYAEWDRYVDSFGFVSIPRNGFKLIIQSLDDETIKQIAGDIGSRQPREFMMFRFKKMSLDNFISQVSLFCKYAGFGRYEIESNERDHTLVVHHDMGRKWSLYLAHLASQGMKSTIGILPKFHLTEYSVEFEFFVP